MPPYFDVFSSMVCVCVWLMTQSNIQCWYLVHADTALASLTASLPLLFLHAFITSLISCPPNLITISLSGSSVSPLFIHLSSSGSPNLPRCAFLSFPPILIFAVKVSLIFSLLHSNSITGVIYFSPSTPSVWQSTLPFQPFIHHRPFSDVEWWRT